MVMVSDVRDGKFVARMGLLNSNAFHFAKTDFISPAIVKLGSSSAGVISHRRRVLERAAVLEVGGDPRRSETVIADPGLDTGGERPPSNHGVGVGLGQDRSGKSTGASPDRPEQRTLGIVRDLVPFRYACRYSSRV